ncbi:protein of unknown function [Pseudodesulfovibrio profundus]|uniref:Uncharacterized protein n=1 Tax=Pseudodesulfovibrio profundus TaxID=57320 RepID=A0A2C8F865_9BACT|nr:protein of unknown function [Pseudodesulfovibrio profundus]
MRSEHQIGCGAQGTDAKRGCAEVSTKSFSRYPTQREKEKEYFRNNFAVKVEDTRDIHYYDDVIVSLDKKIGAVPDNSFGLSVWQCEKVV